MRTLIVVALFGIVSDELKILLVRRPALAGDRYAGELSLPGNYLDVKPKGDANLEACAQRTLRDITGNVFRSEDQTLRHLFAEGGRQKHEGSWAWLTTHVYMAIMPDAEAFDEFKQHEASAGWYSVQKWENKRRVAMVPGHEDIVKSAIKQLRQSSEHTSLPCYFLPRLFTLKELQNAYEAVLDCELDKSNIRTRVLADKNFLAEVEATQIESSGLASPTLRGTAYEIKNRKELWIFRCSLRPNSKEPKNQGIKEK